jgi:L-rhamnose isomerase / sugar isomerase
MIASAPRLVKDAKNPAPRGGGDGKFDGSERGVSRLDPISGTLGRLAVELPSWAFGNSGTRFKVFAQQGVPRDPYEKVADAAQVHRVTGLAPSVALHIPWDRVDDFDKLARHAEDCGVRLGTINTNTFQDDDYKLGSFCHVDEKIRAKAVAHALECIDIMSVTGSRDLKVWLPDGLNYPGQADLLGRQERLTESLAQVYARLGDDQRLVLEYKFFEPAFYATDVPDWGTAYVHCVALGERAVVCLDTGHHAPGTNIEFIVMQLLRLGRLGAFDFNSRFYADDDLMVGAADPFQLFRIMVEVVRGGGLDDGSPVSFMLDQCHNIEEKIPAQIRSVLNVVEMTARALLVDRAALDEAEQAGDVLAGNAVLMDAFYTDIRSALAEWRAVRGLPADPIAAYRSSGYAEQIVKDRVGGTQAGWGA